MNDSDDLNQIISLIVAAGEDISMWLQHEKELQWQHAPRWTALCGTIPVFAFVVVYETLQSGSPELSDTQIAFYKNIENNLFDYYEQESARRHVSIRQCLPLASERRAVCDCFGTPENTLVTMDMLLGIIFPNRCRLYQTDWIEGLPSKGIGTPAEYAAMRLAADLIGIPTPSSLRGLTAEELGIMPYGAALIPLRNFAFSYMEREARRRRPIPAPDDERHELIRKLILARVGPESIGCDIHEAPLELILGTADSAIFIIVEQYYMFRDRGLDEHHAVTALNESQAATLALIGQELPLMRHPATLFQYARHFIDSQFSHGEPISDDMIRAEIQVVKTFYCR